MPGKDSFYTPPAGDEKQPPGAILRNRTVPSALAVSGVSSAYQLLYRTTDSFGDATVAVTTILIPMNADSKKLLSYQVAEDAVNPNCARTYVMQLFSDSGGPFGTIVTNLELPLSSAMLSRKAGTLRFRTFSVQSLPFWPIPWLARQFWTEFAPYFRPTSRNSPRTHASLYGATLAAAWLQSLLPSCNRHMPRSSKLAVRLFEERLEAF